MKLLGKTTFKGTVEEMGFSWRLKASMSAALLKQTGSS